MHSRTNLFPIGFLATAAALSFQTGVAKGATIENFNLSPSATGTGTLGGSAPGGGGVPALYDRGEEQMVSGTGVRFGGPDPKVGQPYLTWSSDQRIRAVRVFRNHFDGGSGFNPLAIDLLKIGGVATNPADWIQRYTSGGPATDVNDIDLGTEYTTRGIRVRTMENGDNFIGELETYGEFTRNPGSIASMRVNPTSWSASSVQAGTSASFAGQWGDRWLSQIDSSNPGTDFFLDRNFTGNPTINALTVGWRSLDSGTIPTQFSVYANTGAGLQFVTNLNVVNGFTYYELPTLTNVQSLRLLVPESAVPAGGRVGVTYSETFFANLPEPTAASLLALAAVPTLRRRRAGNR